ncbi:PREDICTED: uncharacterized protein LOC108559364 [Nicrophorus vespilloides]|uniref:Uncharacterized protein LOC108559364 n=1 Tax=Nicrophorus vespilloides TaxID=110193 RepID=A0ABM1MC08_NICVS|nr:PREDICTED: uncharacterized protein LOC108559364 [Nicrophorus vespilloides]
MWKCHKCGKPVYFAERKQSLGYDWHPECLRCEECGKRLNPGQHLEHKGVPYCHVPCYGALFGPQLFGHGTRVESHKSFGQQKDSPKSGPTIPQAIIETKLKQYNQFYDGKSGEIRSRHVNGRLILEGSLRIHWGVHGMIHLKENVDQRTVVTVRKRNSYRQSSDLDSDDDTLDITTDSSCNDISICSSTETLSPDDRTDTGIESGTDTSETIDMLPKSLTLPNKLDVKNVEWDELDELLQVEKKVVDGEKLYQTMPTSLPSQTSVDSNTSTYSDESTEKVGNGDFNYEMLTNTTTMTKTSRDDSWIDSTCCNHLNRSMSGPDCLEHVRSKSKSPEFDRTSMTSSIADVASEAAVLRRKTGSTAIKRRPGKRLSRSKIKRRCSINGHFYDRETSFFTPPHGSQMSVWVSSLVNTHEVINLMLEKYKVDSIGSNFALFAVRDNGEQRRLKDDEYPLVSRILLGPHEDVVRLFLMDSDNTPEVSNEVAQFLNFSVAECRGILSQYQRQEEMEVDRIKNKYAEMRKRIKQRMNDLKVRL